MKFLIACWALILWPSLAWSQETRATQLVGKILFDKTEVSIGEFAVFAALTGFTSQAERGGGGFVYASGWERKPGWNWRAPFGQKAQNDEPAVHLTFDEAASYCKWAGKRLPTESEWIEAAYTERRDKPTDGFIGGQTYLYPTGDSPKGANCLEDCGPTSAINYSALLDRGLGHANVGSSKVGVNGLYDMGANVWEWVENGAPREKGTRGGSWWYGASQMEKTYVATKPRDMYAVYIGFRCVREST